MTDTPGSPQNDDTAEIAAAQIPVTPTEEAPDPDDLRTRRGRMTTALRGPRALAGSAATIVLLAGLGGFGVGRATAADIDGGSVVPASAGADAGQDDAPGPGGFDGAPPDPVGPGPDQTVPDPSGAASSDDSSTI